LSAGLKDVEDIPKLEGILRLFRRSNNFDTNTINIKYVLTVL